MEEEKIDEKDRKKMEELSKVGGGEFGDTASTVAAGIALGAKITRIEQPTTRSLEKFTVD